MLVPTLIVALAATACRQSRNEVRDTAPAQAGPTRPQVVCFPTDDGGIIYADRYGEGDRAVIFAHGGQFTKESWAQQAQIIAQAGFRVLAIDFRGRGESRGGTRQEEGYHLDVLAAVRYLRESGAETVSIVGASFGGSAAATAAANAKPGEIDRLVFLSASSMDEPERLTGRKLFVSTGNDTIGDGLPRFPLILKLYERAPEPKELVVLEGSAHAQHIFATEQGSPLMDEILRFLSAP